jgi:hypothetical protein
VLAAGVRRLAVIYGSIVAATLVLSAVFGLIAGSSVARAVAIGFYIAGALLLVGCFIMGARGPLRGEGRPGEGTTGLIGARRVRRATEDERSESARTALLLFAFGLSLVLLGSLFDPTHSAF